MATNKLKKALAEHKVYCIEKKKKVTTTSNTYSDDNEGAGKKKKKKHPSKMKSDE